MNAARTLHVPAAHSEVLSAQITGARFARGRAQYGGAVYVHPGGSFTCDGCAFEGNSAFGAGAIYNTGSLRLTGTTQFGVRGDDPGQNNSLSGGGASYGADCYCSAAATTCVGCSCALSGSEGHASRDDTAQKRTECGPRTLTTSPYTLQARFLVRSIMRFCMRFLFGSS